MGADIKGKEFKNMRSHEYLRAIRYSTTTLENTKAWKVRHLPRLAELQFKEKNK
jgi:hypothetical protein